VRERGDVEDVDIVHLLDVGTEQRRDCADASIVDSMAMV
jgi:hypothetical protein